MRAYYQKKFRYVLIDEYQDIEQELAELSHVPDISEEELTVIAGLSEFNAEAIQMLVKNVTLYEDGNIEIVWNADDFLKDA